MRKGHRPTKPHDGRPRFWGRHAVYAALDNPNRNVRKLWGTREEIGKIVIPKDLPIVFADFSGPWPDGAGRRAASRPGD